MTECYYCASPDAIAIDLWKRPYCFGCFQDVRLREFTVAGIALGLTMMYVELAKVARMKRR